MSQQLVATSSASTALISPSSTSPPPAKKVKREKVLDEDTYVDALNEIIQRDFFPDLPKLRTQLEWLEAEENNDIEKMRELQQRLLTSRRPTDPVRATPRGFETPAGFEGTPATTMPASERNTPAATPQTHNPPPPDATAVRDTASTPSTTTTTIAAPANTSLSLDKFLNTHTSEDNASFSTIMDKQHEKHLEKYAWVENKAKEASQLMIEYGNPDEKRGAVQTWQYTVRNQLMYVPEGVGSQINPLEDAKGPVKEILHENTRITGKLFADNQAKNEEKPEVLWAMLATSDREILNLRRAEKEGGKVDLDDLLGTPKPVPQSPKVRGYGFVATPSPAPGVDMSPFTTWGRLDGTPLLVDTDSTPLDLTPGPAFKVPEPPKRDLVAMRLAEKAAIKKRKKNKPTTPLASPRGMARTSPLSSPRDKLSALSPAGITLVRSRGKEKTTQGTDWQLRASYSPAYKAKGAATPTATTPSSVASTPGTPSGASATPKTVGSITDDLLNIPMNGSKGAKINTKSLTDDLLKI
jgi:protein DGCR14